MTRFLRGALESLLVTAAFVAVGLLALAIEPWLTGVLP